MCDITAAALHPVRNVSLSVQSGGCAGERHERGLRVTSIKTWRIKGSLLDSCEMLHVFGWSCLAGAPACFWSVLSQIEIRCNDLWNVVLFDKHPAQQQCNHFLWLSASSTIAQLLAINYSHNESATSLLGPHYLHRLDFECFIFHTWKVPSCDKLQAVTQVWIDPSPLRVG